MIYGVYSIRDVKTGFMSPTIDQNDDSASRNFYHAVVNSDGILYTFASDFSLYHIANFDTDTGIMDPCIPCVLVAEGSHAMNVLGKETTNG